MPYKDPQKQKEWVEKNREKSRAYKTKYANSETGKKKKKESYLRNCETIKARTKKRQQQERFGGNREKAIQRDSQRCVNCGMTREEHKQKYGKDITVDHIDGTGRNELISNHHIDNLQTLCLKCHGSKDSIRGWLSRKQENNNG